MATYRNTRLSLRARLRPKKVLRTPNFGAPQEKKNQRTPETNCFDIVRQIRRLPNASGDATSFVVVCWLLSYGFGRTAGEAMSLRIHTSSKSDRCAGLRPSEFQMALSVWSRRFIR